MKEIKFVQFFPFSRSNKNSYSGGLPYCIFRLKKKERNKIISIGSTQEKGCSIIIFRTCTLSPVTATDRIMRFVEKLVFSNVLLLLKGQGLKDGSNTKMNGMTFPYLHLSQDLFFVFMCEQCTGMANFGDSITHLSHLRMDWTW
jgi:hypothetical protein